MLQTRARQTSRTDMQDKTGSNEATTKKHKPPTATGADAVPTNADAPLEPVTKRPFGLTPVSPRASRALIGRRPKEPPPATPSGGGWGAILTSSAALLIGCGSDPHPGRPLKNVPQVQGRGRRGATLPKRRHRVFQSDSESISFRVPLRIPVFSLNFP